MASARKVAEGSRGNDAIAAARRAARRWPGKRVAVMLAVIAVGTVISVARDAAAQPAPVEGRESVDGSSVGVFFGGWL